MDGNNSLKRMATVAHRVAGDTRTLEDSDYFLSAEYVNKFANEVRGRATKGPAVKSRDFDSDEDSDGGPDDPETEGDPTDGLRSSTNGTEEGHETRDTRQRRLALCVRNWKSAAKDERKKMWAIFDESGVFAAACRHGFPLWMMDMVCSGEL